MSWSEIKKAVNSNLNVPLNHLIWLNDYKTFGKKSYVFNDKKILHELYKNWDLCINDEDIRLEAYEFARSNGSDEAFYNRAIELGLPVNPPFENIPMYALEDMLNRHYAGDINVASYWKVGETITIHNSYIDSNAYASETQPEGDEKYVIIGINHDNLTDSNGIRTKAAVTLEKLNGMKNRGAMSTSLIGTYAGWSVNLTRRTWLNETYKNSLPIEISSLIKPVDKLSLESTGSNKIVTTSDSCFLVSTNEIGAGVVSDGDPYYPTNIMTRKRTLGDDGVWSSALYMWTRSCFYNTTYAQYVCYFYNNNSTGYNGDSYSAAYMLCPAFCL